MFISTVYFPHSYLCFSLDFFKACQSLLSNTASLLCFVSYHAIYFFLSAIPGGNQAVSSKREGLWYTRTTTDNHWNNYVKPHLPFTLTYYPCSPYTFSYCHYEGLVDFGHLDKPLEFIPTYELCFWNRPSTFFSEIKQYLSGNKCHCLSLSEHMSHLDIFPALCSRSSQAVLCWAECYFSEWKPDRLRAPTHSSCFQLRLQGDHQAHQSHRSAQASGQFNFLKPQCPF